MNDFDKASDLKKAIEAELSKPIYNSSEAIKMIWDFIKAKGL